LFYWIENSQENPDLQLNLNQTVPLGLCLGKCQEMGLNFIYLIMTEYDTRGKNKCSKNIRLTNIIKIFWIKI